MSGINFLGSASGLPLNELVTTLVGVERDSKFSRINTTKKTLESSLSGVGQLKSALSAFQTAINKLNDANISKRVAQVTQPVENKVFVEATASNSALAGTFDVKVNKLATGSRLESENGLYSSASDVVSATDGILTFTAGDKSFDIEVTAGMTLNQLRQKINASSDNFGVNANLINAGGAIGSKLVLTSTISGDGNDLVVTNNNPDLNALSSVAGGLTVSQVAQNAEIEIDGIVATSSSNTFTNAIQDIEIIAKAVTPVGSNASLAVATDKDGVKKNIEAFVSSYNELVDRLNGLTRARTLASDGKTVEREGGALSGDSMIRNINSQLRSILGGSVSGSDEGLSTLYALGITFTKEGKLEISTSTEFGADSGKERFDRALDINFDSVAKLFSGEAGLSKSVDNFIKQFNQSGGIIASREQSIRTQIAKNAKDIEAANRYIESFEQTLRRKYSGLDSLLAQMQNMGATVSAQLSNLPGFGTNKS